MDTTTTIRTVGDLIDLWQTTPTGRKRAAPIAFAEDIGIPATTVRSMRFRNAISRKHWSTLLESARKHALDPTCSPLFNLVTAQLLVDVMSNPPSLCADSSTAVQKLSTAASNASAFCNTAQTVASQ